MTTSTSEISTTEVPDPAATDEVLTGLQEIVDTPQRVAAAQEVIDTTEVELNAARTARNNAVASLSKFDDRKPAWMLANIGASNSLVFYAGARADLKEPVPDAEAVARNSIIEVGKLETRKLEAERLRDQGIRELRGHEDWRPSDIAVLTNLTTARIAQIGGDVAGAYSDPVVRVPLRSAGITDLLTELRRRQRLGAAWRDGSAAAYAAAAAALAVLEGRETRA